MSAIQLDMKGFDSRFSASENVYTIIKHNIINLNLKPNQRLSEKEMSELLKVSRTPVRESFIRLAEEGLLEILSQRGTFVSKIDLKEVEESLFIRTSLEISVVKKALYELKPKNRENLKKYIKKQEKAIERLNYKDFMHYDVLFHKEIFHGCGMYKTWQVLTASTLQYMRIRFMTLIDIEKYQQLVQQHKAIIQCIETKNIAAVESVVRDHVEQLLFEEDTLKNKYPDYFEYERRCHENDNPLVW